MTKHPAAFMMGVLEGLRPLKPETPEETAALDAELQADEDRARVLVTRLVDEVMSKDPKLTREQALEEVATTVLMFVGLVAELLPPRDRGMIMGSLMGNP